MDQMHTEMVHVPEWGHGKFVPVRALDDKQKALLSHACRLHPDSPRIPAWLGALSVVRDDGTLALTLDDVPALAAIDQAAIRRIAGAAVRLSGLVEPDDETRRLTAEVVQIARDIAGEFHARAQ